MHDEGIDDFDDGVGTMSLSAATSTKDGTGSGGANNNSPGPGGAESSAGSSGTPAATSSAPKTARCKRCGLLISRSMEAIEAHMEECGSVNSPHGRNNSTVTGNTDKSYVLNGPDGPITISHGNSRSFGGITRRPELENFGTRIIYRTARKPNGKFIRPREVCALQDSFVDDDGVCYVYEISVRHCDVMGLPDYVTADVMVSDCMKAFVCYYFVCNLPACFSLLLHSFLLLFLL